MFVNRIEVIQNVNYLPPVGKSHHLTVEIITSRCPVKSKHKRKVNMDYEAIRKELRLIDWDELLQGNVDDQWEKFLTAVTQIQSRNTTERMVPVPKTLPYMSPSIKRQRNRKLHHWKKRDKPGHYEKYIQPWNRLQN